MTIALSLYVAMIMSQEVGKSILILKKDII